MCRVKYTPELNKYKNKNVKYLTNNFSVEYMLKWHSEYTGLDKTVFKRISPVSFYFLMWILKIFNYIYDFISSVGLEEKTREKSLWLLDTTANVQSKTLIKWVSKLSTVLWKTLLRKWKDKT